MLALQHAGRPCLVQRAHGHDETGIISLVCVDNKHVGGQVQTAEVRIFTACSGLGVLHSQGKAAE